MKNPLVCMALLNLLVFPFFFPLYADVVVTKDDMILNGKITEEVAKKHVRLANYHGEFLIPYNQIREIHRTRKYEDDISLYKKMGKTVDEEMVKTNYLAGIAKIREKEADGGREKRDASFLRLSILPLFVINTSETHSVLPVSCGVSVLGEMPFHFARTFLPDRAGFSMDYIHSEKGVRRIMAFRSGLGVSWEFPVRIAGYTFPVTFGPSFGAGYYMVRGEFRESKGVKAHLSFGTGPEFYFHDWVISPRASFEYVFDGASPFYGPGFSVAVGYVF